MSYLLRAFERAEQELVSYDRASKGGGLSLLFHDSFRAASQDLSYDEKIRLLQVSHLMHQSIKARDVMFWHEWYSKAHPSLTEALESAKGCLLQGGEESLSLYRPVTQGIFNDKVLGSCDCLAQTKAFQPE